MTDGTSVLHQHGRAGAGDAPPDAPEVRAAGAGPADAHDRQRPRVLAGRDRRLRLIKHLVDEVGINLAGVQRLLDVAEAVQRMRPMVTDEGRGTRGGAAPAGARTRAALVTMLGL